MSDKTILLDHGSGGLASQELISTLFLKHLTSPVLKGLEDSAVLDNQAGRLVFTTDSYVVDPLFFPGGDIGKLAVHGTINDLAMRGGMPLCLSLALILEEGMDLDELERIIMSIAEASEASGVPVVTGDTKVVPRGKGDKVFINTSGIGFVDNAVNLSSTNGRPGDAVILSGTMGDHGITIMTRRAGIGLDGDLRSDTMALHRLVASVLSVHPGAVRTFRDPTRGGVATTLNEIAAACGQTIVLDEQSLPIRSQVRAACEILGLEPLYLANEGKCLAVVDGDRAEQVLAVMKQTEEGKDAVVIGRLEQGKAGRVLITTPIGGSRVVAPLHGQPLPRIC
ncbi:MAG: hydrogenase expression/formation protein HypE [Desulfofustis sp.]|nr:hydrogenase expression/formation protein HypE [Desulfofustis sp.]